MFWVDNCPKRFDSQQGIRIEERKKNRASGGTRARRSKGMRRPYQCLGIVAEAQSDVKGICGCNGPPPDITEQAPAAAFLGELVVNHDLLTWVWFADVRESLCGLPKDKADALLRSLKESVERYSATGGER